MGLRESEPCKNDLRASPMPWLDHPELRANDAAGELFTARAKKNADSRGAGIGEPLACA